MASPPPNQPATQQAARNTAIAALAAGQLAQLWPRVDWGSQYAAKAVRTLYGAIVQRYGRSAAAVTAQAYDEIRATKNLSTRYRAVPSPPITDAHLDRIVDSAFLGHDTTQTDESTTPVAARAERPVIRWSEQPADATTSSLTVEERVPRRLDTALSRLVLQPARDTIADNVAADPAKPTYIRVPTGAYTCEFCMMLASRELGPHFSGYADAHNALFRANGTLYHRECDCVAWQIFPGDDPHLISPNMRDYQRVYTKATANAGTHRDMKKILAEMRKVNKADDPDYTTRRRQQASGAAPSEPAPAHGGGGGGGDKPPGPPTVVGKAPFGGDAEPPSIDAQHILDGDPDDPTSGGHRFGTGRPHKTEFPRGWADDKIIGAVQRTLDSPELTIHGGDRSDYLSEVDGVVVRVSTYLADGVRTFRTAYPVNGHGVVYNRPDGAVEARPLNRDVIESYRR